MNILNEHFEDFPIEFKEINPEHFEGFEVEDKTIISPNEEGYITEALHSNIILEDKNTVVINAGVGQGKTYSIIEIVKKYYQENKDYIIFIASPFVSLVEQYYHKVSETEIPQNEIYRCDWIGNREININPNDCRVHIVTANLLLGNPGEDSLISSEAKRIYINSLASKCKEENKKVVFIYDEIHDTIHNFKQELVFNLWKWKDTIHKNFIISATFNEASKIVIEYLAELTDKKIQIIESERKRFPEKQSELYLHFDPTLNYSYNNENITNIIQKLISNGKEIDILSYSKKLIQDIDKNREEGIGKVLSEKYGDNINLCISGLEENTPTNDSQEERFSSKYRYNPDKCNIGTNFKSGVSIEKDNHAFVIIMPPLGTKRPFGNRYGIFSDGINSVIQALARQRKKGEIHIILPPPNSFDYSTLPLDENQKTVFMSIYNKYKSYNTFNNPVEYLSVNQQNELIENFYENTICKNIKDEIEYISSLDRTSLASLNFPNYKDYKLAKGEKYLVRNYPFFGGDLSAYILYCAITNQFINCKLKYIIEKNKIVFVEGKIQQQLHNTFLDRELFYEYYRTLSDFYSEKIAFQIFEEYLFTDYKILFKNSDSQECHPITMSEKNILKQQLLVFFQLMLHPENTCFNQEFIRISNERIIDKTFQRGHYFRMNIAMALSKDESNLQELHKAYRSLEYFRRKMINSISLTGRNDEMKILPNTAFEGFVSYADLDKFNNMIQVLTTRDIALKQDIFNFSKVFHRDDYTQSQKINSLYSYMKNDFFEGESKRINNTAHNGNFFKINTTYELPNAENCIDFITNKDW